MIILIKFPGTNYKNISFLETKIFWNGYTNIKTIDNNIWKKYYNFPQKIYLYNRMDDRIWETRIFGSIELYSKLNDFEKKRTLYHELYHYNLLMLAKKHDKRIKNFYLLSKNIENFVKDNKKIFNNTWWLSKEVFNLKKEFEISEEIKWKNDTKRFKLYLELLILKIIWSWYDSEIFH